MKKLPLLLLISCFVFELFGQIPDNYYDAAYGKKGHALRVTLYNIIKDHKVESYDALKTHFQSTDKKPNGKVWDMYSDIPDGTPLYEYTFVVDFGGSAGDEGVCYNREHSLPKSWFNDASPMNTDLFHLYPTDTYVNGKRGNYAFGEVSSPTWTSKNDSKLGRNAYPGYSGTVFEPIDAYKGDFARTYFYMATRYINENLGQNTNSMFTKSNLDPWALNMLVKWHKNDPVSQKEIDRNNAVYNIQGNRNPFIDYPELVGIIFGVDSIFPFDPEGEIEPPVTDPCIGCNGGVSCKKIGTQSIVLEAGDPVYTHKGNEWDITANSEAGIESILFKLEGATQIPYADVNTTLAGVDFNKGVTTVTWKAVNVNGDSATCKFAVVINIKSGIENPVNSYNVYPNPVNDQLHITSSVQIDKIELTDIQGRIISQWHQLPLKDIVLDVTSLRAGFYLMRIHSGKEVTVEKIVKTHYGNH